ncbi:hypothetical protein BFW01_g5275 [Lasiodiplodia theobromae]|uniref:Uncharacterized protein n=1 Tax=Lasiodiplodia theobromae TaxID=45133 RepID=A0A5N5D578_9PEZI|nr:uncharacterized protein LTHEOB_12628 [Lasiodiplodia theobromae]KAB2572450.1 hypothetical protein DBV05_g8875 [Lasiodiplodia theobromae]KAF4535682.1 hypothetical protein LTHEOB_12628 [Lasiodiplodia theobromae]KAF9634380.1 hypothetical protein BFW01_g5275 [Lasiodiplodia theobromae]
MPAIRHARVLDGATLDAAGFQPRSAPAADSLPANSYDRLIPRQGSDSSGGYIPLSYQGLNSGPAPGTVAGIVLGSVAGFLLIAWLLLTVANLGGRSAIAGEEEIVVRERPPRSPRSRRSRRNSRHEIREVSRSPRPHHIIVEEHRTSVPPPPPSQPRPRSRSVLVEERISAERRVDGDDIVEVIEEHSPPRRHRSRRDSGGYRRSLYG